MFLSTILAGKARAAIAVAPAQTLREVARTLSAEGIGAVLVLDADRRLVGIVSERDIVRAVARDGADVLDAPVSAHMTARVVTASAETSVLEAMERMTAGRFRHLPVMCGDRVDGVVSIGDLVKHRLSEFEHENQALHDYITTAA